MNKREISYIEKCTDNVTFDDSIINLINNIETFAQKCKTLAITTPKDNFLNTFLGYNLAKYYVNNGKKVLVIEANYKEPILKELVDSIGDEEKEESDGIHHLNNGVDVIYSTTNKLTAEQLHSDNFLNMLNYGKSNYDYVIMLVTPVLVNNDLFALKDDFDASIIVAKKEETILKNIYASIDLIKRNDLPLLGVVLLK